MSPPHQVAETHRARYAQALLKGGACRPPVGAHAADYINSSLGPPEPTRI